MAIDEEGFMAIDEVGDARQGARNVMEFAKVRGKIRSDMAKTGK